MKNNIIIMLLSLFLITSCAELELNPLSSGGSEAWYSSEDEIQISLNALYSGGIWKTDSEEWTDNWTSRQAASPISAGSISSDWSTARTWWTDIYKGIRRANIIITKLENGSAGTIPEVVLNRYLADAKFVRAALYSTLITHYGDVVFYTDGDITIEESFDIERTDKAIVLEQIYTDFDFAIEHLPEEYATNELKHATKGAAMAYKARIALYSKDWEIAKNAAQACIDLDKYSLYPNYEEFFLSKTKNTSEGIFVIPRSFTLDVVVSGNYPVKASLPRNHGGWAAYNPSWELFSAYTCVDGLPIDESPLYDPRNPFSNRDPRCVATIVEFGSTFMGIEYDPSPLARTVMDYNTGKNRTNNDSRARTQHASHNGLLWKKGIDEDWKDDLITDPDRVLMRYADVLLMYAEAKMELNEIDQTVFDAINDVRERAYNGSGIAYPEVSESNQDKLRTIIRNERRVEFANEGLRYMDLVRWKLADKALTKPIYGNLDVSDWISKVVEQDLYFFPGIPEIDENGLVDFSMIASSGLIKQLALRNFDKTRQYLWPIPDKEISLSLAEGNGKLTQNPGY